MYFIVFNSLLVGIYFCIVYYARERASFVYFIISLAVVCSGGGGVCVCVFGCVFVNLLLFYRDSVLAFLSLFLLLFIITLYIFYVAVSF